MNLKNENDAWSCRGDSMIVNLSFLYEGVVRIILTNDISLAPKIKSVITTPAVYRTPVSCHTSKLMSVTLLAGFSSAYTTTSGSHERGTYDPIAGTS